MKEVTGTIINVEPTTPDPGYQSQNGFIYTFDMEIRGNDGQPYIGEIGSKQGAYPLKKGEQISVRVNQTEHGPKFKKFNPQYSQQGGQPQGNGRRSPEELLQIRRGNALNAVMSATNIMPHEIGAYLEAGVRWIEAGIWNIQIPQEQDIPI